MDIAFPDNNEKEFLKKKEDIKFIYGSKDQVKHENFGVLTDRDLQDFTVYKSTGEDRKAFERGVNLIYYLEFSKKRDFIFHRNSGMNQVLAQLAKDKDIIIGFSFSDFKKSKDKHIILGRMIQNYRFCKKYNVRTLVASFATRPEELEDDITLKSFKNLLDKRGLF